MRRSLFMMAMALAFTMNVNAVEIEVPDGQPPVPVQTGKFLQMPMKIIHISMRRLLRR